jgi:hypothetical protein
MSEVLAKEFKYFKINCDKLKRVSEQIILLKDVLRNWFLNSKNSIEIKIGNDYLTKKEINKILNINS